MDSTFVFILMLAGLAVVLLGLVLVASERELKNKRREIAGLIERLEAQPQAAEGLAQASDAASDGLIARNRALESDVHTLSSELAQTRAIVETLRGAQNTDASAQERIRVLSSANAELVREADELRSRLAAREADFQTAHGEDGGPASNRMQAEIDELRRALEASHGRVTELEEARKNSPDPAAVAAEREAERQSHRAQIADLEQRLAGQQQELADAQALRDRVTQAETNQQALRAEVARYEEEVPRWQARMAAAEDAASRLAALQAPYEDLLARQADLADRQHQLQEALAVFGQRMAPASGSVLANSEAGTPMIRSSAPKLGVGDENLTTLGATPAQAEASGATDPRTHRFGVLAALLFTAATGVVGVQFFGSEWEQSAADVITAQATAPSAVTPEKTQAAAEHPAAAPAGVTDSNDDRTQNRRAVERTERSSLMQPAVSGTYEVIQPGRVYASPSELSRPLGDIEPGVKVNVVDARAGWLEIHSKHGRPPGFIRHEVAVRIGAAN